MPEAIVSYFKLVNPNLVGILILLTYIVSICTAFHQPIKAWKDVWHLVGQIAVSWLLVQAASFLYYAIFRDNYLTQFQFGFFTFLYMVMNRRYDLSVRLITGCTLWTDHMLIMAILGSTGMMAGTPEQQQLGTSYYLLLYIFLMVAVVIYLRHFVVTEYILARKFSVAIVVAVSVTGFISPSNWGFPEGVNIHDLLLSCELLCFTLMLYTLLNVINREYARNMELLSMQSKADIDRNNYEISHQYYEEMSMMRHELRNRNAYIRLLVQEKKYEELQSYVSKEDGQEMLTRVADYGNTLVNSALNWESTAGAKEGITFDFKISVPPQLRISDLDLFTILRNILDNAREACAEVPEEKRTVRLRMFLHEQYLMIRMENPVSQERIRQGVLQLKTTKDNKKLHGYGTRIIQMLAERHHGEVKYEVKDGIFITSMMLAQEPALPLQGGHHDSGRYL